MHCPDCKKEEFVKNGFKNNKQRYKCKNCGCNFTRSEKKGCSPDIEIEALKLYLEGLGFRSIGRFLGVGNVSVLKWIRHFGQHLDESIDPCIPDTAEVRIIEIDEMRHFTGKKTKIVGSACYLPQNPENLGFHYRRSW